MRQTSFSGFHCSLARSLEAAGDWWSPLIVPDIVMGIHRSDELDEDLGIGRKITYRPGPGGRVAAGTRLIGQRLAATPARQRTTG
jgi:hypothetical protein